VPVIAAKFHGLPKFQMKRQIISIKFNLLAVYIYKLDYFENYAIRCAVPRPTLVSPVTHRQMQQTGHGQMLRRLTS
jgi:hypothetical protein